MTQARPATPPPLGPEHVALGDVSIDVRHLTRTYAARGAVTYANRELSFQIRRGEIFGLLGPNGAGKTTLVLQLMGLLAPTSGSIVIEGIDVVQHPQEVKRILGFLPQADVGMRFLEVRRALAYTAALRGLSRSEAAAQAASVMEQLELGAFADKYVHRLSGGSVRLVNFAMALMGRPRLLVLDEPTNDLDPSKRRLVWEAIRQRNQRDGVTCIVVTHNVLEAELVLHRLAIMREGRIVALDSPDRLAPSSRLHIQLRLKQDRELSARQRAALAALGPLDRPREQEIRIEVGRGEAARAARICADELDLEDLHELRIRPPSLEETYLHYQSSPAIDQPPPPAQALQATARPRQPLAARLRRSLRDVQFLFLEVLLETRRTWMFHLITSVVIPFAMVYGITRIGSGMTDDLSLLYIVTGSAVFAVSAEGISRMAVRLAFMKQSGAITYYASLPASKTAFVTAETCLRMILVVPGVIAPMVAGHLFYGMTFQFSPWLLLLFPLLPLALSAVGVALGSLVDSPDVIYTVADLVLFIVVLAAPVYIPADRLPLALQWLGYLFPPTYAAEALRLGLTGDIGAAFFRDVAVLFGMAVASFFLIGRFLPWRVR